ncbi:GNAT family acetyltransferase [Brevifollis gellanilyticus]|uniref:GNAT family acetyltransferase n=2 Tax=Brevifollis gellanilyticus TaxID=748831 RepID=A0A512M898_9BACT|nr:GNAT family acetyltransferase [Brevifollis gellanilyticus]
MQQFHFLHLSSREIYPWIEAVGNLRLRVFREYPYLYEGTLDEERHYLSTYAEAPTSLIVLVKDGENAVGATTCVRMNEGDAAFAASFEKAGMDVSKVCYLGESVLLPAYRGQGIGKAFFQYREEHARQLGCTITAFCAVDRPSDHPSRPEGHRPLDAFWQAQGYEKHPELQATFVWKEIHESSESPKTLTFWLKTLA